MNIFPEIICCIFVSTVDFKTGLIFLQFSRSESKIEIHQEQEWETRFQKDTQTCIIAHFILEFKCDSCPTMNKRGNFSLKVKASFSVVMADGCLTGRTLFDRLEPREALNRETLGQYCLFCNRFFETGNRKQWTNYAFLKPLFWNRKPILLFETESKKQWANIGPRSVGICQLGNVCPICW